LKKGTVGAAMSGAGIGATAGAAAGKGMQGLAEAMGATKSKSKMDTKEFEVPTEENMNRPKATRAGGPSAAGGNYFTPHKKGGMVSSASKRADGCAIRGKTKGRMV
jgi:hypothetical protein